MGFHPRAAGILVEVRAGFHGFIDCICVESQGAGRVSGLTYEGNSPTQEEEEQGAGSQHYVRLIGGWAHVYLTICSAAAGPQ